MGGGRRRDGRRAAAAVRHRRHAAARAARPSTRGRCIEAIDEVWGVERRREPAGRGGGPHRHRDRARDPAALRRRLRARSTTCSTTSARPRRERYVELVPDDLSERLAPGAARSSPSWPRARTCGSSLVTGNLEPIARLKLARAGIGSPLRGRAGRLRVRLRGPHRPAADRAPPRRGVERRRAVAGRADRRRRRHAARHRLRARRRRARRRRHDGPVRRRPPGRRGRRDRRARRARGRARRAAPWVAWADGFRNSDRGPAPEP